MRRWSRITLSQATINLMIGYDPPASSAPDPNDPQAGNAAVDAGIPVSRAAVVEALSCTLILLSSCLSSDEVEVKWVMNLRQMGARVGLRAAPPPQLSPLRSASGWPGRRIATD